MYAYRELNLDVAYGAPTAKTHPIRPQVMTHATQFWKP